MKEHSLVRFVGRTREGNPSRYRALYAIDELGDARMLPCRIEGRYRTSGGHDARFRDRKSVV